MNRFRTKTAAVALACTFAAGCATQTETEHRFGDAVRATNMAQIHDVGAALYPSKEAPTGGEAGRLENVVNAHRGDVAQPQQVQAPISVGSGSSR